MKIGITGFRGKLGNEFLSRKDCFALDCDITDLDSIKNTIKKNSPDIIINCAAFTSVDLVETNLVKSYEINAIAPNNLAKCFPDKIIQISTDYIFKGDVPNKIYSEIDVPSPQNSYGFGKMFGEMLGIDQRRNNILVVRTTVLYTHKNIKTDFVRTIYQKLKNKERITAPHLFGNPTYIPHLVNGILKCIELDVNGKIHIAGKEIITRLELAHKIADTFGFDHSQISEGISWGIAKRPVYYGMDTTKAQITGIPIYSVDEGLKEFKENILK